MLSSPAFSGLWFSHPVPRPHARLRLFCLPYAGGGMAAFRPWAEHLPDDVELCLVNLPGREARMREIPYTSIDDLVTDLSDVMLPLLDRPFAFFGHSMGALIAYALTRKLGDAQRLQPQHLLVSARRAPQIPEPDPPLHQLSDAAFVVGLVRRYNGIPKAILQDIELLKLYLPTLRADLTMIETYRFSDPRSLDVPITAFGGWEDGRATPADLTAWRELSIGAFAMQMFPGGHFYIQSQREELLKAISDALSGPSLVTRTAVSDHGRMRATPTPVTMHMPGNEG